MSEVAVHAVKELNMAQLKSELSKRSLPVNENRKSYWKD